MAYLGNDSDKANQSNEALESHNDVNAQKEEAQAAIIEEAGKAIEQAAQTSDNSLQDSSNKKKDEDEEVSMDERQASLLRKYMGSHVDNPDAEPVRPQTTEEHLQKRSVGALLRYHRERLGFSLNEVASAIKVRANTLSDIENDNLMQYANREFASRVIFNYAKVLRLDPEAVVSLYEENLSELIKIPHQNKNTIEHKKESNKSYYGLLIATMIIVAIGGYFIFKEDPSANKDETEIVATGELGFNQEQNTLAPIESDVSVEGGIIVDESDNIIASENVESTEQDVVFVDKNTAKAMAQAQALQNDLASQDSNSNSPKQNLTLPNNVDNTVERIDQTVTTQEQNKKAQEAKLKAEQEAKAKAEREAKLKAEQIAKEKAKAEQEAKLKAEQEAKLKAEQEAKAKAEQEAQEKANANISLNSSLKDVSSSVKVLNREGLASLNSVTINFVADAAIKVTDGSNKVLQEGTYSKGKSLKLTGIPPIKVAISDTSAIKVSYMGGSLSMPKDKQVVFTLPLR